MTNDISIDCETLGTGPNAMLLSIGAVRFDRHSGELGPEFYRLLQLGGPYDGVIDASTVQWWAMQSEQARADVFGKDLKRARLVDALSDLSHFCRGAKTYWQRGDRDGLWLESAYGRVGLEGPPWKFWELRDQRTVSVEFGHLIEKPERGTAHNALADAKAQADELIAIYSTLRLLGVLS